MSATTCCYQYVGLASKSEVYQIFMCRGLGTTYRIKNYWVHLFLAGLFSHCTSVAIYIVDGRAYFGKCPTVTMFSWGGTWYLSNEESEGFLRKQEFTPKESMIWNQSRSEKMSQVRLKLHLTEERLRLTYAAVFLVWNLILTQWGDWRYPQEARIPNESYYPTR